MKFRFHKAIGQEMNNSLKRRSRYFKIDNHSIQFGFDFSICIFYQIILENFGKPTRLHAFPTSGTELRFLASITQYMVGMVIRRFADEKNK
jgi:hypothetical protein